MASIKGFPEIVFDLDGKGDAYLVTLDGEFILDINELHCSVNDFDDIFQAGLKAGLAIAAKRNNSGTV